MSGKAINQNNKKNNKTKSKDKVRGTKKKRPGQKMKFPPGMNKGVVFTTVMNNRDLKAQGSRDNIMIPATANALAVQAAYVGLASMALGRAYAKGNTLPIYWAYLGGTRDLIDIMSNKLPGVFGRLQYLNEILGAFSPKSVPFRGVGEIAYYWSDVSGITLSNVITVRGFNTYMWENTGPNAGVWSATQAAPGSPADDSETAAALARLFNLLSDDKNVGQRYGKGSDLGKIYSKDVSAFASCLEYYGAGNSTTNGPAMSVENEVPFLSIILANIVSFVNDGTRVSRYLRFGSGDSTFSFGLGALASFNQDWYRTAYAPVFKFIDLAEVVETLKFWYQGLLTQAATTWKADGPSEQATPACSSFPFTARQFTLMVRQCVLSLFNDTQSLAQFLKPSVTPNGFEALRVGSNCYGKNISENMLIPSIVRENIANLFLSYIEVRNKYYNPKNIQMVIPVWGWFTSYIEMNPQVETWDSLLGTWVQVPMFFSPDTDDPRVVDCLNAGGDVIDVNNSNLIGDFIKTWNFGVDTLRGFSLAVSYMGGSSGSSKLLTLTRIYEYKSVDMTPTRYNQFLLKRLYNNDLVKKTTKKVERTNSKTKTVDVVEEMVTIPNGSGVSNEFVISYTSLGVIDNTVKQALPYIILPFIPAVTDEPPTQNQWRTAGIECKVLPVDTETSSASNSRFHQILTAATSYAPGLAASGVDEFSSVIEVMNGKGLGGFFGDLVGNVLTVGAKALGNIIPI